MARARSTGAWTVVAHALGALALGGAEAARLGGDVGLVLLALLAATGVAIGAVIALAEAAARAVPRGVRGHLVRAAPVLFVAVPVGRTLFDGAYAQTLPLARATPILIPLGCWLGVAAAVALARRVLASGDRTGQAIAICALGGATGAVIWCARHVLGSGYADAHAGATVFAIACAGALVRALWAGRLPRAVAAAVAGAAVVAAGLACVGGLADPGERARLAAQGDQGRDLVRVWRGVLDLDRDGASALLGGGDCDDRDPARHPGAREIPGDGIDQDCDGRDALLAPPAPSAAVVDDPTARSLAALRARTAGMSVVLVTVDALRYDLLAPDAPARADFPRLSRLLDESAWWTRAIAPASGTDVSLCTLLTGRLDPYQPVAVTLPEALRALGRRTYSAIPGEVTRYVGDVMLGRGVDHPAIVYTDWAEPDVGDHVSASATTAEGLKALDDAAGRPAFVWLHYFDVHEHHQIEVTPGMLATVHDVTPGPQGRRYRALLREIDAEVGRLLDELARRGLADHTIVVFASDHGESLGEDARFPETHGQVAYGPLVRVPLAVRVPGVPAARHRELVTLVDVAPTVLSLLGAPAAMGPLDGRDLAPALVGGAAPAGRAVVVHEELQHAVVEWPLELVVRPADNVTELYDLEADPGVRHDLAAARPAEVRRLTARYAEAPEVRVDRTPAGRTWREQQAQPPPRRAPPGAAAATPTP